MSDIILNALNTELERAKTQLSEKIESTMHTGRKSGVIYLANKLIKEIDSGLNYYNRVVAQIEERKRELGMIE